MMTRREWLGRVAAGGVGLAVTGRASWAALAAAAKPTEVAVYKSPTCGCCSKWVEYMRSRGFHVTAHDLDDVTPIKTKYGVPQALASCHTALVSGYVVEGHVPADVIQRLLKERPKVVGVAVPGMVVGTPGMEGARQDHYDVIAFERDGKTRVYARR